MLGKNELALVTVIFAVAGLHCHLAATAELHAMVSGALTGAFRDLIPRYEQVSGNKVVISWGPSSGISPDAIPVRLDSGEKPDVLIMVDGSFKKLVFQGKFATDFQKGFAISKVGVGVKAGAAKPDVGSPEALRRALLNATSIGYSEGASGVYVSSELLTKLGIADQVMPKAHMITGELVGEAVVRGEIEMALQQVSELKAVKGVDFVGPLPESLQKANVMVVAIAKESKEQKAAKDFVDFLTSTDAAPILTESGLDSMK